MKYTKKESHNREYFTKYFNPPAFDWFHKWEPLLAEPFEVFMGKDSTRPYKRATMLLWKSKRTGKVKQKKYDYQIN